MYDFFWIDMLHLTFMKHSFNFENSRLSCKYQ